MFPQNSYNEAPIPDGIELGGETFAITRRGKQICLSPTSYVRIQSHQAVHLQEIDKCLGEGLLVIQGEYSESGTKEHH